MAELVFVPRSFKASKKKSHQFSGNGNIVVLGVMCLCIIDPDATTLKKVHLEESFFPFLEF